MTAAVASAALWRARLRLFRLPPAGVTAYLSVVLILCKSFGSSLYGIVLLPLVRWAGPRLQMRVAVFFVSIALLYPALRSFGLFPTQPLLEAGIQPSAPTEGCRWSSVSLTRTSCLNARSNGLYLAGAGKWTEPRLQ